MPPRKRTIELSLFDYIDEAAAELRSPDHPVTAIPGTLTVFCENFFLQFFTNVLEEDIRGISDESRERAARVRLDLVKKKKPIEVIQLVGWFERLCRIHPDIVGEQYEDDDRGEMTVAFTNDYALGLLERIVNWAKAARLSQLRKRAEAALENYRGDQ